MVTRGVLLGLICATGLLAACDSPSPRFMQGTRHEARVSGSTFTIYRRGDFVEIYRTSMEMMPSRSDVFAKAARAVRQATGCAIVSGSMEGDAALMKAEITCP